MNDNNKNPGLLQHFLEQLALEEESRCELEASVWLMERLQAENENLKAKLANRDLNIRNLTSLLDAIPGPRNLGYSEKELENLAYLRDNFIDDRMVYYADFGLCEEDARESAEEDALEHFPAALAVTQ